MANHTQTLDEKSMLSLLEELHTLSRAAKNVREKLLKVFPVKYGSDIWWEKETKESLSEYERGEYKSLSNIDELMKDLDS